MPFESGETSLDPEHLPFAPVTCFEDLGDETTLPTTWAIGNKILW
jgi:hypothetical protein